MINDVPAKKPYQVHANSRWYSKDKASKQDDEKKEQEEKQ